MLLSILGGGGGGGAQSILGGGIKIENKNLVATRIFLWAQLEFILQFTVKRNPGMSFIFEEAGSP